MFMHIIHSFHFFQVIDVNNAPYLIPFEKTMDIISTVLSEPFNSDRDFTVGEITEVLFKDDDEDDIGLAIIGANSNELGMFRNVSENIISS